ncbi:MAG: DUF4129 domain-containing protein [Chloroflexota bacterium]|nr:DUF4129 domain-containing protein [Chloroflexota bacterium]
MNHNPWLENLFRPLMTGVMVGCIAFSLVELVHLFFPSWNGTVLILGCILAALEANYSYRLTRTRSLRGADVLKFRVIELAMFFILLKIGGYIGDRWADVLTEAQTWPQAPLAIFDPETMVTFILALISWVVSTQTVRDLERIGEPPEPHRRYVPPMESLSSRFFWGGAALLIVAGVTRIGIAALLDMSHPSVPGLVLNVLVYFLLGLVMLGQVQFTQLHKQWQAQGIEISKRLAGRWVFYSLAFIGLAALLAFLLPTGYTIGFLEVVGGALELMSLVFWLIIIIPLNWLLWLLSRLLGNQGPPSPSPPIDFTPPEFSQQKPGGGPGWFDILRSLLFWAVALGMVFYVVRSYLRDRPELLETLSSLGPIRALRRFLSAIWRRLVGLAKTVGEHVPRQLSRRRARQKRSREPLRFFRLGALSPRERILYYYLSILRRAGKRGFPRQCAQTPHEYDTTLRPHLPEAQQEMNRLTQTFVEARYSRRSFDREQEQRVRAEWQRVKAALRALKRKADAESTD